MEKTDNRRSMSPAICDVIKIYDYYFGLLLVNLELVSYIACLFHCLLDVAFIRKDEFCLTCQNLLRNLTSDSLQAMAYYTQLSQTTQSQRIICFPIRVISGNGGSSSGSDSDREANHGTKSDPSAKADSGETY